MLPVLGLMISITAVHERGHLNSPAFGTTLRSLTAEAEANAFDALASDTSFGGVLMLMNSVLLDALASAEAEAIAFTTSEGEMFAFVSIEVVGADAVVVSAVASTTGAADVGGAVELEDSLCDGHLT